MVIYAQERIVPFIVTKIVTTFPACNSLAAPQLPSPSRTGSGTNGDPLAYAFPLLDVRGLDGAGFPVSNQYTNIDHGNQLLIRCRNGILSWSTFVPDPAVKCVAKIR